MSRRTRRAAKWAGAGLLARVGWALGGYLLVGLGLVLLGALYWLSAQTGSLLLAVVLLVLLLGGAAGLVLLARDLGHLLLGQARGVLTPPMPRVGEYLPSELGTVYEFRDPSGVVRYHGSSAGARRWMERMEEHLDAGKLPIGPGWTGRVEFLPSREAAYDVEAVRIDRDWSTGQLLNRRREGRGSR